MRNPWSEELEADLRRLWEEEALSASQIAQKLGYGVTRNAVIGKASRLGLDAKAPRKYPARRPKRVRRSYRIGSPPPATPRVQPPPIAPDIPDPDPEDRVALVDLEPHHCRYPIGHLGEPGFGFCGRPRHGFGPYCPTHLRVTHRPTTQQGSPK